MRTASNQACTDHAQIEKLFPPRGSYLGHAKACAPPVAKVPSLGDEILQLGQVLALEVKIGAIDVREVLAGRERTQKVGDFHLHAVHEHPHLEVEPIAALLDVHIEAHILRAPVRRPVVDHLDALGAKALNERGQLEQILPRHP